MKIEKAIKELRQDLLESGERKTPDLRAAQRLGIEALKEVKNSREEDYFGDTGLLPGETEE